MGEFTRIIKLLEIEIDRHNSELINLRNKLDRLRGIVKDSPREKLDDIQRQVTKLKDIIESKWKTYVIEI